MRKPLQFVAGTLGLGLVTALSLLPATSASAADPVTVQVLATNDFHGRIQANGAEAGAAVLSGAVKQLRAANPNTVFAAAGDLIGASTFESFIQHDKPTIDALNEAGLDVSAVGNHELDQGYDDLVNRVMAPFDTETNPYGGAAWEYIAANLNLKATGDAAVPATWTQELSGVQVGFVGAVTEELPALVSPDGIADIAVADIVTSVNKYADQLTAEGADVIVMLVHEGSPSTDCASMANPATTWGNIVTGVDSDVDAIVSGHTHLAYNCEVGGRPVVSAGQYGTNLNQLNFTVDPDSGAILDVESNLLQLAGKYPADAATAAIVKDAVAKAEVLGAEVLGRIEAPAKRARLADGTTENRGGESTLGNMVAEVQRWATEAPESGGAQIAFMNPGGLRADMTGPSVTYKQAAQVQPFANTLINMDLTGAQIETILEQQWQRTSDDPATATVPSRPFLRLGVSDGFRYTYTEEPVTVGGTQTYAGEITGMWLDGAPIDPAATYSVTANSFLAAGGDNFREFAKGTSRADTGKVDLAAMVDYMAEHAAEAPLDIDFAQRAVAVQMPADAPDGYRRNEQVSFDLASLAMTGVGDLRDDTVSVTLGGVPLGTFPVDNTIGMAPYDRVGTASVTVTVPKGYEPGHHALVVTGNNTGTEVVVPIEVLKGKPVK
jgi:5'-nucleotidase